MHCWTRWVNRICCFGLITTTYPDYFDCTSFFSHSFSLFLSVIAQQPLCPKELWHFVHQCYGNELGLTSDDEDYVPPDDDFNTMGWVANGCYQFYIYSIYTQLGLVGFSVMFQKQVQIYLTKMSLHNMTSGSFSAHVCICFHINKIVFTKAWNAAAFWLVEAAVL